MPDFITLSCPSCGSPLQITEDIERFACKACGNEHIVNRSGGIVTLKPVLDVIKKMQVGVDKTASELAISRLTKEINEVEAQINSVLGRKIITKERKSRRTLYIIIGFIFILGLGGLFSEARSIGSIFLAVIMLIVPVAVVVLNILDDRRRKAMVEEQQRTNAEDFNQLNKQLDRLKSELKTHREIVSTY
jgi:ABC-type multidrug transport system fused ATPase/permease subunit